MARNQDFVLGLKIKADLQKARDQIKGVNKGLDDTGRAGTRAKRGATDAAAGINKAAAAADKINAKLDRVGKLLVGVFAVHNILRFTRSMIDANVAAQGIHDTLEQVFGADGVGRALEYTRREADRLGVEVKSLSTQYGKFAATLKEVGAADEDIESLFSSLNETAMVLGVSTDQLNTLFRRMAPDLAKGVIRLTDIDAINRNLPGSMGAVSKAAAKLGYDVSKMSSSDVIPATAFLREFGITLHDTFGAQAQVAAQGLGNQLQRLHNTLFNMKTDGGEFGDRLAAAIGDVNDTLNDPGIKDGLHDLIKGLGEAVVAAVRLAAKVGVVFNKIVDITKFVAEQVARNQGNFALDDRTGMEIALEKINKELDKRKTATGRFMAGLRNAIGSVAPGIGASQLIGDTRNTYTGRSTDALEKEKAKIEGLLKLSAEYAKTKPGTDGNDAAAPPAPGGGHGNKPLSPQEQKRLADQRARAAAEAAAAQKKLMTTLVQMQAEADPAAAAWAKYNQAVEEANEQAETAKRASGANRASIDAQRNAVIQLAATARDAALDKIAEQDRKAWDALKKSLATPAEVAADKALAQIHQLNELMSKGVVTAGEYKDAMRRIGRLSVPVAPEYQGLDAAVGGAASEFGRNNAALEALNNWHDQALAANDTFRAQDLANEEAYQARKTAIETQYADKRDQIDRARQQLTLQTTASMFGNLADIAKASYGEQSKQYRLLFALSKGFAAAQAAVSLAINISKASEKGFPQNIGFIAGALAQGAQIASILSAANYNGYADGGYTGAGGKHKVAGVVHAGEGVLSQRDMTALGGPRAFESFRKSLHGYADGGVVNPLMNVPGPVMPAMPSMNLAPPDGSAQVGRAGRDGGMTSQTHIHVWNSEQAAEELAKVPSFQQAIVHVVGENPRTIQSKWGG